MAATHTTPQHQSISTPPVQHRSRNCYDHAYAAVSYPIQSRASPASQKMKIINTKKENEDSHPSARHIKTPTRPRRQEKRKKGQKKKRKRANASINARPPAVRSYKKAKNLQAPSVCMCVCV
jgi:hypothetical protein